MKFDWLAAFAEAVAGLGFTECSVTTSCFAELAWPEEVLF